MTDPAMLWDATLDYLRAMPGVEMVEADWQNDGSTATATVEKDGTVVLEGTGKEIVRIVVINDTADLAAQVYNLVSDFRFHIRQANLPPTGYIRGSGVSDDTVSSEPVLVDGVPSRVMALNYRVRGRWLLTLDTFVRATGGKPSKAWD